MENDLTFVAPEGVYSNVEDHRPSAYNTHIVYPVSYPTKLSTIVLHYPLSKPTSVSTPGIAHWQLLGGGNKDSKNREKEINNYNNKEKDDGQSLSSSDRPGTDEDGNNNDLAAHSPTLHPSPQSPSYESPKLFSSPSLSAGGKKKPPTRPKHNIRTTTSTFVTRIQSAENLNKVLQNKQGTVTYLFYNHTKNFFWTELGVKAKEPLARITFSAFPTCHDVNKTTARSTSLDVVIGFNTGDLIWFDPIDGRYVRLNKQGCISNSPCTAVRWVPGSPSVFVVSHADGTIIVYDKEREDGTFTAQRPFRRPSVPPVSVSLNQSQSESTSSSSIPSADGVDGVASGSGSGSGTGRGSSEEWDPLENIFVTTPNWHPAVPTSHSRGKAEKDRMAKNPVSHWRVSKRPVVDIAYSSDARLVAACSEDGCLRIIDALQESLVDCFASYFGSFTCVAFSDDSRFVITGGQDDLVTIFSMAEGRVIARCQGHSSFISSVAFDPVRTDKRSYRFGSVGEDNKLILWDFSAGVLHRPKLQAAQQQRLSMSSTLSLALRRRGDTAEGSTLHLPPPAMQGDSTISSGGGAGNNSAANGNPNSAGLGDGTTTTTTKYHPAPSRNEVSVVQPVLTKHIEGDLLTALSFTPSAVLTASKVGVTKVWVRPLALRPRPTKPKIRGAGAGLGVSHTELHGVLEIP